jgi:Protein of unknown function (DUF3617)
MGMLSNRNGARRIIVLTAWASLACASQSIPPGLYEVTTETSMPHLEENLRYSTIHERRCLAHQDLSVAFPVLAHPALKGCSLGNEAREGDVISYALLCNGGHGTTGEAVWELGERQISGTLRVKLGGKNMTFHQRVTATRVGQCAAGSG